MADKMLASFLAVIDRTLTSTQKQAIKRIKK